MGSPPVTTTPTAAEAEQQAAKIPPPQFRSPECPLCDHELSFEDGWYCDTCSIYWPDEQGPGRRYEEDEQEPKPACGAEHAPYAQGTHTDLHSIRYQCVLDAGHHDSTGAPTRHAGTRTDSRGEPDDVYGWPVEAGATDYDWTPSGLTRQEFLTRAKGRVR